MLVTNLVDGKAVIQEVPKDWLQCSVSFEYRPPEEFRSEGVNYQTRTNCTRTYEMPLDEMLAYGKICAAIMKGPEAQAVERERCFIVAKQQRARKLIAVEAYISALKNLPEGSMVAVGLLGCNYPVDALDLNFQKKEFEGIEWYAVHQIDD